MDDKSGEHGNISVGDITKSQGVAIGNHAQAQVTGHNISGDIGTNLKELKTVLEEFYDSLGTTELPREKMRSAQIAAGDALRSVSQDDVKSGVVIENVKKVGEALKEANVTVQEGTSLWESITKLAPLLGPLVGGAHIVASWFGVSF